LPDHRGFGCGMKTRNSVSQSALQAKPWPAVSLAQARAILTRPGSRFEMEQKRIRGIDTRVWKHAPPTLRDVFLAGTAHGEREFLVYEAERASYRAFSRATLALARALTEAGVRKGDRVAIAMRNLPEWPAALFAALLVGAIATPLNAWWTGAELEYALKDSGAKIAFVDAERFERIAEHLPNCPALERVFVSRDEEEIAHPVVTKLEDVLGRVRDWEFLPDRAPPDIPLDADDDATIFYTSGTTGHPKGALGTHRNSTSAIIAGAYSLAQACVRRGEPVPQPGPPSRTYLLVVPFFHATGCQAILIPALFQGAKIVLMRRWDAEAAMQLIERERCSHAGGVPTIAWQLIEHPARQNYDLSSLEAVGYGGAPAASELVRRIKQAFPQSSPSFGWGMTETAATFTTHQAEDYLNRPDSCGPAVPVCDMRIVGAAGETLPPGEVGELWARGPNVVRGYWNNPEATAQTFADGWLKTGDLAKLDEEGFCYIVDRKKDMLIRGGENIYSIEVEEVLYSHPAVMDAALVGIPHRTLGEEPGAVVTLKPGAQATEAQLREFVAARLAAFKVPVKIAFWPGPLPRNPNGKILKGELKRLFEA
jgi:long-chain acyl-CoA synthetase